MLLIIWNLEYFDLLYFLYYIRVDCEIMDGGVWKDEPKHFIIIFSIIINKNWDRILS